MKNFIKYILKFFIKISYSEDLHHIIYSTGFLKLKFRCNNYNRYKSSKDTNRIKEYLDYKKTRNAKKVVYTCITNDYDDINEILIHKYIDKDWDYIIYTDNKEQIKQGQIGIWEVHPLQFNKLDNARNNRFHKFNPHLLFSQYEESIYLDATINILTDYLFKQISNKNFNIIIPKHYKNNCIYQEYKDVIEQKKDDINLINKEYDIIKKANMPKKYGFGENNIIYRKHNDETVKKIDEECWYMIKNYSKRDQLSFCYLLWKYGFNIKLLNINNSRIDHKNFQVMDHIAYYKKNIQ